MKLRMIYDKRKGKAIVHHPPGVATDGDADYIYAFFDRKFGDHMKKLGYDLKTLKFEISPMPNKRRFKGQDGALGIYECDRCNFEFLDVPGAPVCPECGEDHGITKTER